MKSLNIVCKPTGIARFTSTDLHISDEHLASKLTLDFSELIGYEAYEKWVDFVLDNGTSLRYNLGIGIAGIVDIELTNQITVPGPVIITPFLYDGIASKIKFKTDHNLVITKVEEAGDDEAPLRDDYIFDLAKRIDNLDGEGAGSKGFLFDITNPKTSEELAIGEMAWDNDHKTIQVRLSESVYMQIGQEQPAPFKNDTSEEIAEGTPMYVSGVLGLSHQILVKPLSNDNYENCKRFIGVTTEIMPPNDVGFITMAGAVHNVSAGAVNNVLYVGDKVLTDVKPVPPLNTVVVGMQGQVDQNAVVFVRPDIRKSLEDLNNVLMTALIFGDIPYWDGEKFINHNLGPQWTDLTNPMTLSLLGKNLKPDYDDVNIGLLFPQNDPAEYIDVVVQMPHGYKEGSTIHPHIHIEQNQAPQAVFKMDYKWYNIGDPIPAIWSEFVMNSYAMPYTSGNIHQLIDDTGDVGIDGTGKKISSVLKARIYRDDNVYIGDCLTLEFDIHYQIDAFGSIQEYIKQ